MTALDAVREEIAALRLHVSRLECAEAMLGSASALTGPSAPIAPSSSWTPASQREPRRQNPTRAELRGYVIEQGPITRRELLIALGGNPKAMDEKLARLLANGEIAADGRPRARRYRPPDASAQAAAHPTAQSPMPASQTPPERGVYPLYDAIVDLNGATTQQLVSQTGLPSNLVVEQGRRLMQLGLARFTGTGDGRMWLPSQPETGRDAA